MLSQLEEANIIHLSVKDLPDISEELMNGKTGEEFLSGLVEGIHKIQVQWREGWETVSAISFLAFHICISYFLGVGTEVDEAMGLKWLCVSALGGHPAALVLAPLMHRSCHSRGDYGGPWRLLTVIGALITRSSDSLNLLRDEHPVLYQAVLNVIKSRPLKIRDKEHGGWHFYETLFRYCKAQDRKPSLMTLEEAIKSRNSEIVRNLLETGADASVIVEGPGLMHYLSWIEDSDAASLAPLLFANGARLDVLATDEENLDPLIAISGTPLLWAVLRNSHKFACVLLDMHVQHNITAEDAEMVFILAAAFHNFELLEHLFKLHRLHSHFFRLDFLGSSGEDALLPELLTSAGNRHNLYRIFQRRIHGANFRSAQRKTLKILLLEGADPTIPFGNQGWNHFVNAITNDDEIGLRVFIDHIRARHRDPVSFFNNPQTFSGDTCQPNTLQICIYSGAKQCFKVILEMFPDLVEKRNARSLTALHSASILEDTFYLKKLLEHGAKVVVYGKDGSTPLAIALCTGNIEAANLIAERCSSSELEELLGPSAMLEGCTMIGNLVGNWLSRRSMKVIESVKWVHAKGGSCFFSRVPGNRPAWNVVLDWREPVLERHALLDAKLLEVLFQMFPDKLEWQEFDGMAPIHVAAWNGNVHALKLLIDMGVNINQETIKVRVPKGVPVGLTALNIALDRSKAALLPDDVRAGGINEISKWKGKMEDIVTMLLSRGGCRSGDGADWRQHLEVLGRTIPGVHVISSMPSQFPIPEEARMGSPWPEQLPRDESSLSEDEINSKREALRPLLYEIETLLGPVKDFERVWRSGTTPPEGLEEALRFQIDIEKRRWREGDKLPMGWGVRDSE